MKQKRNINLKLPISSWLFFLFLSSVISFYNNSLQFGKPVQVERVDQLNLNSSNKRSVAEFSLASKKNILYQKLDSQYFLINLLSERLDNSVHIALNRQTCLFRLILQNLVLHLQSPKLSYNSSDDFSDFIS